jgi:hypothetical protein
MLVKDHSWRRLIYGTLLPMPVLIYSSVADMYQVERLKLHCASKMWDMASEETVTSFL